MKTILSNKNVLSLQRRFSNTKQFPQYLITQNKPAMRKAFTIVPVDILTMRIQHLQLTLQSGSMDDSLNKISIVCSSSGKNPYLETILDRAFLEKYEELREKVIHVFNNFFPYRISSTTQDLFIFEKLDNMELVEYVLAQT